MLAFLFIVLLSPVSALLFSAVLSLVWKWFILTQYGPGPSYQTWYGISLLWQLLSWTIAKEKTTDISDKNISVVARSVIATLVNWILIGIVLLVSLFVRFALGWS